VDSLAKSLEQEIKAVLRIAMNMKMTLLLLNQMFVRIKEKRKLRKYLIKIENV